MSTKLQELADSVVPIDEIPSEQQLQYLLDLPPGGVFWALDCVQDGFGDGDEMHCLIVAIRSLSKIEFESTCEAVREEASDTIEAVLERLVNQLNGYCCGDC